MSEIEKTSAVTPAISTTENKAIQSQAEADQIETKKSDAEGKISTAKSEVTDADKKKAEIEDKLATPTPQESSKDKKAGDSTTAVPSGEKEKLQSALQAEDTKITQATNAVQAAHVELSDLQ